jgi:lipopolysaccharide export system protein LptA
MRYIVLIYSSLLATTCLAKTQDFSQPIEVNAIKQTVELQKNTVTFHEKVIITQGTLKIKANKVTVIGQKNQGAEKITAQGQRTHFSQRLDNGLLVEAKANVIEYDVPKRHILLQGKAELKQSNNTIKGNTISYNLATQQLMASGDNNLPVSTVFLPADIKPLQEKP